MRHLLALFLTSVLLLLPAAVNAAGCPMTPPAARVSPCHNPGASHPAQSAGDCSCMDHQAVLPMGFKIKPAGDMAIIVFAAAARPVAIQAGLPLQAFARPPPGPDISPAGQSILTVSQRFRI